MRDMVTALPGAVADELPAVAAGAGRSVLILGAGASGTLLAIALAGRLGPECEVTLLDPAPRVGRGIAYGGADPVPRLNSPAAAMGAEAGDPDGFRSWLAAQGRPEPAGGFAPRILFGRYLAECYARHAADPGSARLRHVAARCTDLRPVAGGVEARLEDGRWLSARVAVLATGHVRRAPGGAGPVAEAWAGPPLPRDRDGRVLLVGSGLTMIDQALSLLAGGHRGPILAVSRRGLMPRPHAPARVSGRRKAAEAGTGAASAGVQAAGGLSAMLGRLRAAVRAGGDWQGQIDLLRPAVPSIWAGLSPDERARFLRHAAPYWEVHRHRAPRDALAALARAGRRGSFALERAAFLGAERGRDGLLARLAPPGGAPEFSVDCVQIRDCRGPAPLAPDDPLTAALLARGLARPDPLGLGLQVTGQGALVDARGHAQPRLFALGPPARAGRWETGAIPEIRTAAARLAEALGRSMGR